MTIPICMNLALQKERGSLYTPLKEQRAEIESELFGTG